VTWTNIQCDIYMGEVPNAVDWLVGRGLAVLSSPYDAVDVFCHNKTKAV
jgi:hypothetical protein